MGTIDALGFEVSAPNAFQRTMWLVASSRPGAWFFSKTLHHIDRFLLRLTGGRLTFPGLVAGLPVITLVTIGARSGGAREVPLVGVPAGEHLAVIGTSYGQPRPPAWAANLRAHPEATVRHRDRTVPVRAREASGAERDAIWARGREVYAGYEAYARRLTRPIGIFVLESSASERS